MVNRGAHGTDEVTSVTVCGQSIGPRATQVGALLCDGLTNKEIAILLGIKPSTVNDRVDELLRNFGVKNRQQLAVMWVTSGRPRGVLRGS